MAAVAPLPVSRAEDVIVPDRTRPMTRQEFEQSGALGIYGHDERLELIGGEVIRKVSPQLAPHATGTYVTAEALRSVFPKALVRVQLPLALGAHSEPEPDVAVVEGAAPDYATEHPTGALLVVEVSDSTLRLDRREKASLYARFGIADYWIVNLRDRVLEVHREPAAMEGQPFGHHYRSITRHVETDSIAPLAAPDQSVGVSDLFPKSRS